MAGTESTPEQQRLDKLDRLIEAGIDRFRRRWSAPHDCGSYRGICSGPKAMTMPTQLTSRFADVW